MGETLEFDVDWDALQRVGRREGAGTLVRVNDALHVVDSLPTARSVDGLRPAACTQGSWAVRRTRVEGADGIVVEVLDYHALHPVGVAEPNQHQLAG